MNTALIGRQISPAALAELRKFASRAGIRTLGFEATPLCAFVWSGEKDRAVIANALAAIETALQSEHDWIVAHALGQDVAKISARDGFRARMEAKLEALARTYWPTSDGARAFAEACQDEPKKAAKRRKAEKATKRPPNSRRSKAAGMIGVNQVST